MKHPIFYIICLFLISNYTFAQQKDGLKEELIRLIIRPYEGVFGTFLDAHSEDETKNREDFLNLFINDEVIVYNDIPVYTDGENTLKVKQYCGLAKAFAYRKPSTIKLDFNELFICSLWDTTIYIHKTFAIDSTQINTYIKIKVRYFPTSKGGNYKILYIQKADRPDDADLDKSPDDCDKCMLEKGEINLKGCPDTDGDGIDDKNDMCIDVRGTYTCHGCPDEDGDGVTDKEDICPELKGYSFYSGCPYEPDPDTDKDGIPDKKDKCPSTPGVIENSGCPDTKKDTDSDGIPDINDKCPTQAGLPTNFGCPMKEKPLPSEIDSDKDGIVDSKDKCPNTAGPISNFGCPLPKIATQPDTDKDGITDDKDACPDEYAITDDGCPPLKRNRFRFGVALSGGGTCAKLSKGDPDIKDTIYYGFSPSIFMDIKLTRFASFQIDLFYTKKGFRFYNYGNNFEYGYGDSLSYFTENARFEFQEYGISAKINVYPIFVGGYYGLVRSAKRSGDIFCADQSGNPLIISDNYQYDLLDKNKFPILSNQNAINKCVYGISFGLENKDGNVLYGIGYDLNLSNYFNNKYPLWNQTHNIDFYDSKEIKIRLNYFYLKVGLIFP